VSILSEYIKEIIFLFKEQRNVDAVRAAAHHAHKGQTRKATGDPYIVHPERVAEIVDQYYPNNDVAYAAALLHDTLEDAIEAGNVLDEEEMLAMIQDSIDSEAEANEVIQIVRLLTRPSSKDYSSYVYDLAGNNVAMIIKLADMLDNLEDYPSQRQKEKYAGAFELISNIYNGKPGFIHPGHWKTLEDIIQNE